MANFEIAYNLTAKYEGGYANVKGDNGGETYAGIARKFWPNWEGWNIVDKNKPLKHNQFIKDDNLKAAVKSFYKRQFWDSFMGDKINDQAIANRIYDFGVNAGVSASIKMVQRALGVTETGKITESLISLINNPINKLII